MISALTERAFKLMQIAPVAGDLVEFGVYKGGGISAIFRFARKYLDNIPPIYGFDSFGGMPPTNVPLESGCATDWASGTFADTSLENVQQRLQNEGIQANLTKGIFADLRPLDEYGIDKIRFAHIDADIYEGYRDALRLITPHVQIGTVILFDESIPSTDYRYQGVRFHGKRAVEEWENATGLNLHLIRFEWTVALCVIVDESYLKQYAPAIVRLRRNTLREAAKDVARTAFGR